MSVLLLSVCLVAAAAAASSLPMPVVEIKYEGQLVYGRVQQSQVSGLDALLFRDGYNLTFSTSKQNTQGCYLVNIFQQQVSGARASGVINIINKNYGENSSVVAFAPQVTRAQKDLSVVRTDNLSNYTIGPQQ